jgi:hypothetical protein
VIDHGPVLNGGGRQKFFRTKSAAGRAAMKIQKALPTPA